MLAVPRSPLRMPLSTLSTKGHSHGLHECSGIRRTHSTELLSHRRPLSWVMREVCLAKARDLFFWGGDLGFRWEKRCISGMQKAPQAKTVLEVSSDIVCRYLKLDVGLS